MKIDVCGLKYDLELRDSACSDGARCYGLVRYSNARIEISTEDVNEQRQAAAIIHEVMHAILVESGHPDHSEEHITALGNGMTSFLRNNRELIPVILGDAKIEDVVK